MKASAFRTTLFSAFLALFLASAAFPAHASSDYGGMHASVEKQWTISIIDPQISEIDLEGYFLVNNSFQRVVSLETNGVPKQEGEMIKISYEKSNPQKSTVVYARAVIETAYPADFSFDAPLPTVSISNISGVDWQIRNQSLALANGTVLQTTASVTEWVSKYITYNIAYLGTNPNVTTVFQERQGVCTEYSRLAAAMFSYLGLKTRTAYGYSIQDGTFQPHAWVEVDMGGRHVPADATYGEAGTLSGDHIIMLYSNDTTLPDSLNFVRGPGSPPPQQGQGDLDFSVNFSAEVLNTTDFANAAQISDSFDAQSGGLAVTVANPTGSNLLLRYDFVSPKNAYGTETHIIAVPPGQSRAFTYALEKSGLLPNYIYTIPFTAHVQGTQLNGSINYSTVEEAPPANSTGSGNQGNGTQGNCPVASILLASVLLAAFGHHSLSILGAR